MNPFKEIWFNTGKCIDHFLRKENRRSYIEALPLIQALAFGFIDFHENRDRLFYLYYFLIAAPAIMFLYLRFLFPWLLFTTGKLMSGQGTIKEFRIILGLASIPYVLNIFYIALAWIIPGDHPYSYGVIDLIVWVCVWRVMIIGVAKAQRISYQFALMNIAIPAILIVAIYLVLRY
jgi:hypothetical protein